MPTKKISTTKKGFTIIEVVLVLAIAGLIFLMVFVALPALQSSQRDTQRRDDVGRLVTAITTYQANNGKMPETNDNSSELNTYLGQFDDPSGSAYRILVKAPKNQSDISNVGIDRGKMYIFKNANCEGDRVIYNSGGSAYFAVVTHPERGNNICQDNS